MTPYARVCTRLTRQREAEVAAWGNRLAVGEAARARIRGVEADAFTFVRKITADAVRAALELWAMRRAGMPRGQPMPREEMP